MKRLCIVLASILVWFGALQPAWAAEVAPMLTAGGFDARPLKAQPGFLKANVPVLGAGGGGAAGPVNGDPTSLVITSAVWTSTTDLAPVTQFVNGWTGDITWQGATPAGAMTAYPTCTTAGLLNGICGSFAAPTVTFPMTVPTYDSAGVAGTTSVNVVVTGPLREVYANSTLPSEAANGGNAKTAVALNDFVHASDVPGTATFLSGFYVSNVTTNAKSGVTVTNNSTRTYERPVGVWINSAGDYIGASQGYTVEFFGGQSYGAGGVPLAAVKVTACDAGQAHCSPTKTVSTPTPSAKQFSTSCTGTNGSNVLMGCANTYGVIDGMRFTVPGIPGEPRLKSHTSTSLTFAVDQLCNTTLNSGDIKVITPANLAPGDALADGAFTGATLVDANIVTPVLGSAVITSETLTADITTVSNKSTQAVIHTGATTVTANASHLCTINQNYQGSTGSVTATAGNPVPVYSAAFSSSDLSTLTDGPINFRVQAYPVRGDVILDSQTGADGTNCDWWYINVTGSGGAGVCDSGNAAYFNANGTANSPNLHNLWAYLDKAAGYAPAYVWVTGTGSCNTATCVSTSAADPTGGGAGASASTLANAITALKAFNNARSKGSFAGGGVICLTSSATIASFALDESAAVTALTPPLTVTSATANGGNCTTAPSVNSDWAVQFIGTATVNNRRFPLGTRFNNMTFPGGTITLGANETATNTGFTTNWAVFNNDKLTAGVSAVFNKIGVQDVFNSVIDETAFEGRFLQPVGGNAGAVRMVFGSTAWCNTFVQTLATASGNLGFNELGNVTWDCPPNPSTGIDSITTALQATSTVLFANKFMGELGDKSAWTNPLTNALFGQNIWEEMNSTSSPVLQISGDSANAPTSNINVVYNTITGARENDHYLEGVPVKMGVAAAASTFSASTNYLLIAYALRTNPTVQTSTDGIQVTASTFTGTAITGNTQVYTVDIPCNPNYVAYIYVGPSGDITGTNNAAKLGHYGTIAGADATQVATCQTVQINGIGSAQLSPSVASTTSANMLKTGFFRRFNIINDYNAKSDLFGGTTGQANSVASGGKVGNWEGRHHVGYIGNVYMGTAIGTPPPFYGPGQGPGEFGGQLEANAASNHDITYVKYKSDRSIGILGATPTSPALNLGYGNYCLDTSVTNALGRVPSGYAQFGVDIQGLPRLNNSNGAAGAYERGCT